MCLSFPSGFVCLSFSTAEVDVQPAAVSWQDRGEASFVWATFSRPFPREGGAVHSLSRAAPSSRAAAESPCCLMSGCRSNEYVAAALTQTFNLNHSWNNCVRIQLQSVKINRRSNFKLPKNTKKMLYQMKWCERRLIFVHIGVSQITMVCRYCSHISAILSKISSVSQQTIMGARQLLIYHGGS